MQGIFAAFSGSNTCILLCKFSERARNTHWQLHASGLIMIGLELS
jgi:hypothetical protein